MAEKLYYWAENLESYSSDSESEVSHAIGIKRLNFFIGKNNSGKSRFLREIFISKLNLSDYNFLSPEIVLKELLTSVEQSRDGVIGYQGSYGGNSKKQLVSLINEVLKLQQKDSKYEFVSNLHEKITRIFEYYDESDKQKFNKITEQYRLSLESFHQKINFNRKFYIPILRGMRPVSDQENRQPYIERAQKDYFKDRANFNAKNIITGECLFHELKEHLLGIPQKRELIRQYEKKLSQYFFDNEEITLIPFFGKDEDGNINDVVHIKIGNDDQFPIYRLGDGLQQAIILTYEAFIQKNQIHAFFIEEPELHMHAGMVRQLMNFYLNETNHYYFFTTHSNHLLDMIDESNEVLIQKFVKQPRKDDSTKFDFKIYRCDRDHELLTSLGVRPSSVYLANCTIWVEGVTDRMYLSKLMLKYIRELESSTKSEDIAKAKKYKSFMPNFHYAFIEYAGGNITHWSFLDDYPTKEEALKFLENNKGLTAKAITKNILLLADGDNKGKAERLSEWETELSSDNVYVLPCKEIENTLDPEIVYKACLLMFKGKSQLGASTTLHPETINNIKYGPFQTNTKSGFDIDKLELASLNLNSNDGIGKIIDDIIRENGPTSSLHRLFSAESGTISNAYKVKFCEICKVLMTYEEWQLTDIAKKLCENIFRHIEKCNS
jgi:hypothetical protein